MRNIFLLGFILSFISPIYANSFCTLKSESETDVTLEMNKPYAGWGFGTLNYKNKPEYFLQIGISNGYGGQYFHLKNYAQKL